MPASCERALYLHRSPKLTCFLGLCISSGALPRGAAILTTDLDRSENSKVANEPRDDRVIQWHTRPELTLVCEEQGAELALDQFHRYLGCAIGSRVVRDNPLG